MSSFKLEDNSNIEGLESHSIVTQLANKDLATLDKENFIVFPQQLKDSDDLDRDNYIFQQKNGKTRTCNVVGIISNDQDEFHINSRFSKNDQQNYFLRYMIQQVLNYNVINNQLNQSQEMSYYDLLVFLFPYYLNKALAKGVYKEYVQRKYNDANIKGPIDIAGQIKNNIPFVGKVSYRTREFSYDNNITELIRHTLEKIQLKYNFLLLGSEITKENARIIHQITSSYSRMERENVVQNNILNPVKYGYFKEYAELQRLCIQILTEEKIGFGDDGSQVYGIIIDVAWLWEEYICKITGWKHYGRKEGLATKNLFQKLGIENQQHRYPDFEDHDIPIDTKYKRNIDKRNDYNQLATYIHIMKANKGIFLQPTDNSDMQGLSLLGELYGGGKMFSYKFFVPQKYKDYPDFKNQIKEIENKLKVLDFNQVGSVG
jgi:5-methylcytosine-specific restriction endonuclease McrBC regulatory subunit McrC